MVVPQPPLPMPKTKNQSASYILVISMSEQACFTVRSNADQGFFFYYLRYLLSCRYRLACRLMSDGFL